jgi:hypothetical protein
LCDLAFSCETMKILLRLLAVTFTIYIVTLNVQQVLTCDDHIDATHNDLFDTSSTFVDDTITHSHRHVRELYDGEVCGFESPSEDDIMDDASRMNEWRLREKSKSVIERIFRQYTIPIYFHVIQTSTTTGIVSDTRISDFVDYLNEAFTNSNVPFTFEFMGVTRTIRSDWGTCNDRTVEKDFKSTLKVGGADTLNVYICNPMYTAKGASITGYSTGPSQSSWTSIYDGVVINNDSGERRLNTLVHETVSFKFE